MRTKDELFRAAQREVAARRQQAVMQAETARRAAYAAHPSVVIRCKCFQQDTFVCSG